MALVLACLSVLLALFSLAGSVFGQSSTEDFVSIDCGVSSGYSYMDTTTKITYVSDDGFIDAGVNSKVANNYINTVFYQDQTLRSFPTGNRNCYTLNVTKGNKYFLRATFMYGNYDGLKSAQRNNPLSFDVHLGVNKWDVVKIYDSSVEYMSESVTVAESNTLSVCLINIGEGTPFISALEMRPFDSTVYPESTTGTTISFLYRFNYGAATNQIIRYPDDLLDRIWIPYPNSSSDWKDLSVMANSTITGFDNRYQTPNIIYQTAVTPISSRNLTVLHWVPDNTSIPYYQNFYMCELRQPSTNDSTQFTVYVNGDVWFPNKRLTYLNLDYLYTVRAGAVNEVSFVFAALANSTLPPIVNGAEVFWLFNHTIPVTDEGDVNAINGIKVQYGLKKNWMGDPCNPSPYLWDGLKCSYSTTGEPKIISVNLSSSGLTGAISDSFNQFQAIKTLDLSCNNLSGAIPDFLGSISTLQTLDLRGNNFIGSIPGTLQKKNNSGLLSVKTGPCTPSSSHSSSKATIIAIAIAIPASLVVIVVLVVLFLKRRRKQQDPLQASQPLNQIGSNSPIPRTFDDPIVNNAEIRPYTYKQIENITNNFSQVIGEGGFGKVYRGLLENSKEVAVKLSSQAALQHVVKQFLAEANNLTQVHHRNLVSLAGYCRDGNYVALIYEFMSNGSLHDHLRGKPGIARPMSWAERVRIALEAAQGLHYLHTGRNMVHRDVKSSNILLGKKMEAKVADFGLSKISSESGFMQTKTLCGTPGYFDPEANLTQILNEKSDVYSFGVVLLEIITGEPPIIIRGRENVHIIEHVKQKLQKGNIYEVADPRLFGEYDENSIWKIVDLAMHCTSRPASQRPTMADVVKQLQDSLETENKLRNNAFRVENMNTSQASAMDASFSSYGPLPR
ncbi:hypothetical protein LUZ60_000474 [Juncus effusus]|nr:hypothetical protein LUZ60_000474 [Juncus effusus]